MSVGILNIVVCMAFFHTTCNAIKQLFRWSRVCSEKRAECQLIIQYYNGLGMALEASENNAALIQSQWIWIFRRNGYTLACPFCLTLLIFRETTQSAITAYHDFSGCIVFIGIILFKAICCLLPYLSFVQPTITTTKNCLVVRCTHKQ